MVSVAVQYYAYLIWYKLECVKKKVINISMVQPIFKLDANNTMTIAKL